MNLPWFVVGGGLPNLPTVLAGAESYSERLFDYRPIDRLADADARIALVEPAAAQGVSWDPDAIAFVISESGGYPFFLQQFGKTTWDASAGIERISLDDAIIGVTEGQQQLDAGFYSSLRERASRAERDVLRVMAADDGAPSRIGEVADRLGKKTTSLGPARASLIGKGIVYSPSTGMQRHCSRHG